MQLDMSTVGRCNPPFAAMPKRGGAKAQAKDKGFTDRVRKSKIRTRGGERKRAECCIEADRFRVTAKSQACLEKFAKQVRLRMALSKSGRARGRGLKSFDIDHGQLHLDIAWAAKATLSSVRSWFHLAFGGGGNKKGWRLFAIPPEVSKLPKKKEGQGQEIGTAAKIAMQPPPSKRIKRKQRQVVVM